MCYKMNRLFFSFLVVALLALLPACRNGSDSAAKQPRHWTEKELIAFNRKLLRQEKKRINAFIKSRHWKMKETGTGLRYQVLAPGKGPRVRTGQVVTIRYSTELLDGRKLDSGIKTFKVGFGGVESGLEEGILLMRKGEEARFVLPSHLAYGLSGDGNKIPPHAPLVYVVELLKLK